MTSQDFREYSVVKVVAPFRLNFLRLLVLLFGLGHGFLAFGFVISDIRVEGLQRVSAGTVFGAVPYSVGDNVGTSEIRTIVRSLFATESFEDVQVGRDGNVLVIVVSERPTIDSIEFDGNKAIKTEALLEGLESSGLAEGQIFKKVTLEHIAADLERQYVSQGRYDAAVSAEVEDLPRNRVAIKVDVYEGNVSGIRHINIVGNTLFDDETLIDLLELKLPGWLSFYTKDDQYSKEKLQGDLEKIESYYLDRGYLNFSIDSTQVSIAPNMEDVYITINITEGEQFVISAVDVAGELRDIPEASIRGLLLTQAGQIFSREYMTATEERIEMALGNSGYTFASATGEPVIDENGETVTVRYFVDAGKRAYVRRVNFQGNTITQDEVLRREMRQMEGGWASTAMIEGSKIRLQRLGFFKEVNVETPSVPGTEDQIDVNYTVEEQPSGSISLTVGFAEDTGLILGLAYSETNVFGSGNSFNIGINRSDFQEALNVSFFDPYYTVDGVSRGYSFTYRKSNFEERNIASFSTDSLGASVNFGYPISEISRIGFSVGIESTDIKEGVIPAQEISEFLDEEGDQFDLVSLTATYSMSALNRGLLPTAGRSQSMSFEMTVPGSELEFYRFNYSGQIFFQLFDPFVLRLRANLGYGDAYGKTNTMPFYKHFFAGGMGSVRGFESNSLGPRSTPSPQDRFNDPDPIGGNALVELSAEVLFPLPFIEDQSQMKSVFFFDAGNVFNTNCPDVSVVCLDLDEGELRYSAGIAVTWITGFAPISFALSFPINDKDGDETESFQFELGKTF
jgi:outer membrane protein insertion porin family